ncbi:MAG: hypothetical protein AB7U82_22585 [Blastocatellales bacterium]
MDKNQPDIAQKLSIQLRLRRITVEYGYVSVEVTPDLIQADDKLSVDALFQRAVEIGQEPQMVWYKEEQDIEPHPAQQQREIHEQSLIKGKDGFELI